MGRGGRRCWRVGARQRRAIERKTSGGERLGERGYDEDGEAGMRWSMCQQFTGRFERGGSSNVDWALTLAWLRHTRPPPAPHFHTMRRRLDAPSATAWP